MSTRWFVALMAASLAVACQKGAPSGGESKAEPDLPPAIAAIRTPKVVYSDDATAIARGKELFAEKGCSACHKIGGGKLVGPDLKGVTARRDSQWLARMVLKPDVMIKEDATAKELFKTHMTPMPNQGVDPDKELAPLLSYLKANET